MYLDDIIDDLPAGLVPRIRYVREGGRLKIRLQIRRDNTLVADETGSFSENADQAAIGIADALVKALLRVPAEN